MKIPSIEAIGLRGATLEGGVEQRTPPGGLHHTILIVRTDGGCCGYGSVSTREDLVRASLNSPS